MQAHLISGPGPKTPEIVWLAIAAAVARGFGITGFWSTLALWSLGEIVFTLMVRLFGPAARELWLLLKVEMAVLRCRVRWWIRYGVF